MTLFAQQNEIGNLRSQFHTFKANDVVQVETQLLIVVAMPFAPLTETAVSLPGGPRSLAPFRSLVERLPLRRDASFPAWVILAVPSSVGANLRIEGNGSSLKTLVADFLATLCGEFSSDALLVACLKLRLGRCVASRSPGNPEVLKPVVNGTWCASDHVSNLRSVNAIGDVLLIEPFTGNRFCLPLVLALANAVAKVKFNRLGLLLANQRFSAQVALALEGVHAIIIRLHYSPSTTRER